MHAESVSTDVRQSNKHPTETKILCLITFLTTTNTTESIAAVFCTVWHGQARACFGRSAAGCLRLELLPKLQRPESHCRLPTLAFYRSAIVTSVSVKRQIKM